MIRLVASRLRGDAYAFYMGKSVQGTLPDTLLGLFVELRRTFGDPLALNNALTAFNRIRQGGRSVAAYAASIQGYLSVPGMQDITPFAQVHRFREGLNSSIQSALLLYSFDTLDAIIAAAHAVEQRLSQGQSAQPRAAVRVLQRGDYRLRSATAGARRSATARSALGRALALGALTAAASRLRRATSAWCAAATAASTSACSATAARTGVTSSPSAPSSRRETGGPDGQRGCGRRA